MANAHPMASSLVDLSFYEKEVKAELFLPVLELKLGWQKDIPLEPEKVISDHGNELKQYLIERVKPVSPDGRAWKVTVDSFEPVNENISDIEAHLTLTPPEGAAANKFDFQYGVILDKLTNHESIVSVKKDWKNGVLGEKPEIIGTLNHDNRHLQIDRSNGSWFAGFSSVFQLGARHIAEGTDHLLFLLALLLPAPLLVLGKRWEGFAGGKVAFKRITKVVTSFTIGHSITLILGALGWVKLPSAVIESAIAFSIFVSAIHALIPIMRGREVFVAGAFGLVHGLAFASTLSDFGFDPVTMVSSVFGFNIGIEAFQLLVICASMPWLVMLAKTKVYTPFRIAGAIGTGVAALFWFFERAFKAPNPVGPVVEKLASHGIWILVSIAVVAILARKFAPLPKSDPVPDFAS